MPFSILPRERPRPVQPIGEIIRENIFEPFRERILYPAAAAGAVIFLPLALHHMKDWVLAAALWTVPMVMLSYFVLRRRAANAVGMGMLLLGVAMLLLYHEAGVALRFFVALGLCVITINVLLEVLESLHARLIEQSVTDTSTGAFNRRHMETCLQHVLERHRRNGSTASLLVLDIDRFAKVNDRFGVEGGDRVLRAFVEQVKARVRSVDLMFRCGGEKFAVLLPDTRQEEAAMIAELLRADVAHAPLATGHLLTMSLGVAELRAGDVAESWVKRADVALRNAKDEGRNRVMVAGAEKITSNGIPVAA